MDKSQTRKSPRLLGRKYALLIGINYFGSKCELQGCHSDINDVANYLKEKGFKDENVVIMIDDKFDVDFAFPTCPTKDNIQMYIQKCVSRCRAGDTLYIHYSGHGSQRVEGVDGDAKDEKDGIDECICPVDFETSGMIVDDELRILLVDNLPKDVKLRVVFDACHSGSALDLPIRWDGGHHFEIENDNISDKDVIYISGCKDPQYSSDSEFSGHPNGALTWAFLRSLNSVQKRASKNKLTLIGNDNSYTWKDLGDMIRLNLKREGYEQIPQISMMDKLHLKKHVDI